MYISKVVVNESLIRNGISLNSNKSFNFVFSDCTDIQQMFHELSTNVMDVAYERAKEIAMITYLACQSEKAWTDPCSYQFQQCTKEISGSNDCLLYTSDAADE